MSRMGITSSSTVNKKAAQIIKDRSEGKPLPKDITYEELDEFLENLQNRAADLLLYYTSFRIYTQVIVRALSSSPREEAPLPPDPPRQEEERDGLRAVPWG